MIELASRSAVLRWCATSAALGVMVPLVVGSGLFGLASDSATSAGSDVRTGTFTPPQQGAPQDLKVARVSSSSDCASASYSDGPFTAALSSGSGPNLNLDNPEVGTAQDDRFCLKNSGTQEGRLTAILTNVVDTEVGACEASEAGAGDTSCSDGQPGELAGLLRARWDEPVLGSSSPSCVPGGPQTFATHQTPQELDAGLLPGQICEMSLAFVGLILPLTESQKLLAQTDRVQWDIVFTLEEIVP